MSSKNWIVLAAAALLGGAALAQATPSPQPMPAPGMQKQAKKDMMMGRDQAAMPDGKPSGGMTDTKATPRADMSMPPASGATGKSGKPMPKM